MKTTEKILETSVINLHEEIVKSRSYEIASMKFDEVQKAITENNDWDYLRELMCGYVNVMYKTYQIKKFIEFIHENNYEE